MDKVIFHIDVNSAFLSWEAVYRVKFLGDKLDLRTIPSAVGGDVKKRHGIILAKSIAVKPFRIQTGESIRDALIKCPELVLVPPQYDLYDACSKAFINILKEYSPCVEQYSIDEAYCDMTGTECLYESPVTVANAIRTRIYEELGFSVNIGISSNKLLAKMASDLKKPNMVHTLFPYEIKEKMWRLPVSELFYVGRATTKKLHTMGIHTIGELATMDIQILRAHFKKYGELIYDFANGIDSSFVTEVAPANKGYGNSTTTPFDVDNEVAAKLVLLALAETVSTRLRNDMVVASVVTVSIVDCEFRHSSHQMTLFTPTHITNEIYRAACKLFDEAWDGIPIRHLGIHTSKIKKDQKMRQLSLFDMDTSYEKREKLDKAIDSIRCRYGVDSIKRASFVSSPIYHMSGGITPDKKKIKI
jgi:DNA polymerase-4